MPGSMHSRLCNIIMVYMYVVDVDGGVLPGVITPEEPTEKGVYTKILW